MGTMTSASFFQNPATYKLNGGNEAAYRFKESLNFVGHFTSPANGRFVPVLKKIFDFVGPALAHAGNVMKEWKLVAGPGLGAIDTFELLEPIGSANYFLNGDLRKDLDVDFKAEPDKKRQERQVKWASIAGQVTFAAVSILGVALFIKEVFSISWDALGAFAQSIGLGALAEVSAVAVLRSFAAVGFGFLAINQAIHLVKYCKRIDDIPAELRKKFEQADYLEKLKTDTSLDEAAKTAQVRQY